MDGGGAHAVCRGLIEPVGWAHGGFTDGKGLAQGHPT